MSNMLDIRGVQGGSFQVGRGFAGSKRFTAGVVGTNKPYLEWNATTSRWEQSVDGVNAAAIPYPTQIVWNPAGGGDATTWAEVMALVTSAKGGCEIVIATSSASAGVSTYTIPSGTHDMKASTFRSGGVAGYAVYWVVLAAGAVLHDLRKLDGVRVQGNSTAAACLTFHVLGGISQSIELDNAAQLVNNGSIAMIATSNVFFTLVTKNTSGIVGGVGKPVFDLGGAFGGLAISIRSAALAVGANSVSGVSACAVIYNHDGSRVGALQTLSEFAGTQYNAPVTTNGGNGPTAARPPTGSIPFGEMSPVPTGCVYYDTTLARNLVFSGSAWIPVAYPGATIAPIAFRADGYFQVSSGIDITELPAAITISKIVLRRGTAGTAGTTEIDILKNGTSIFTTTANRPKLLFSTGNNARTSAIPDTTAVAAEDRLELQILSIEDGAPQDLVALIVGA